MKFETVIYDSLDAVSAADWDSLAYARSVYQDAAWYRAAPAPGRLRLVAAHDGAGRLRALLPLFIIARSGHYYHSPREVLCGHRELALMEATSQPTRGLRRAAECEWLPALISVSPYGYRGGVIAGGDRDDPRLHTALARAADELCRREGVRVAAHYYLNEDDDRVWLDALAARGARQTIVGADCNLDVRWSSLGEYFRDLGPRGRRLRAKHRRLQRTATRAMSLAPAPDQTTPGDARGGAITELFASAARRHGDCDPPRALYERALRSWPGARLLLTAEAAGGVPRSALLVFQKGGKFYPKFYGADGARDDYFFLTYTRLLELAIAGGTRRIEYGGGSHQAKLLRGARLRWLFASLQVYDRQLSDRLDEFLPYYETAKYSYFTQLALRFHVDHAPAPAPACFAQVPS